MTQIQTIETVPVRRPAVVEANLNYLLNTGERPRNYAITPPEGEPQRTGKIDTRRVRIRDARRANERFTLDGNGFELHAHRTALADFSNEDAIRNIYYPEAIAAIREWTGASKVVIFDHTRRFAEPGHKEAGVRETVDRVHNDQTFVSGPRRVRDHLPREEAEQRLQKRHAIINFWRPIGYPAYNRPLALCDARSIDQSDLIPTDLVYADKVGETYSFVHNAKHSWLYFPELSPDEVLLLKIYDSRTDGTARLTAHTAFDDPTSQPGTPARRSIELRTLVFWDE
ncbi:MAG: CmcJ/NvfI family oxidoreductase [Polyangiaceae bacterium]